MNRFVAAFTLLLFTFTSEAQIPYGDNKEVGKYILLNDVKHYYEVYGNGMPLLLIHGNSTGIKGWAAQIEYFSKKYKVYAIDCRGRGKSELGKDSLGYMQMAGDMAAFIKAVIPDSVYVVGKSDGGIVGLLMGIYYPEKIKKIVSFSANLVPDTSATYATSANEIHEQRLKAEEMLLSKDTTQNWYLIRQRNRLMEFQPHISARDLQKIKIPVLVISTDRDVIKEEHTFYIYKNIPLGSLCFLNGETHQVARKDPEPFNLAVDRFLSQPFKDDAYRFTK